MARTSATLTTDEVSAYEAFCAKHGIIDSRTQDGIANANFVENYFLNTWKETMSEKNPETCLLLISSHLKFYASYQQEFEKLYTSLSVEEQTAFKEWKGERGLKDSYKNAVAILSWIKAHGFVVTRQNLQLAVGQSRVQTFLEWDESATPRHAPDPRQHQDDGTGFLAGKDVNEPRWKRGQREREEREAAEAKSGAAASARSAAMREAQRQAEGLKGNTWSESEQIGRVFVNILGTSEIDWPATLQSRLALQKSFTKHREVSRFIR